eukprot:Hpha_TRINITY_DN23355_c0_g1::TRINITY_DN23355_c0_g1_i1::g.97013::m.97013
MRRRVVRRTVAPAVPEPQAGGRGAGGGGDGDALLRQWLRSSVVDLVELEGWEVAQLMARAAAYAGCKDGNGGASRRLVFDALVHLGPSTLDKITLYLFGRRDGFLTVVNARLQELAVLRLVWRQASDDQSTAAAEQEEALRLVGKARQDQEALRMGKAKWEVDYRFCFALTQARLQRLRQLLSRESKDGEEWACENCGEVLAGDFAMFAMGTAEAGGLNCHLCGSTVAPRRSEAVDSLNAIKAAVGTEESQIGLRALQQLVAHQRELVLPRGVVEHDLDPARVTDPADYIGRRQYESQRATRALLDREKGAGQAATAALLAAGKEAVSVSLCIDSEASLCRRAAERAKRAGAVSLPPWAKRRRKTAEGEPNTNEVKGEGEEGEGETVTAGEEAAVGAVALRGEGVARNQCVDVAYYAKVLSSRGDPPCPNPEDDGDDEWITPEQWLVGRVGSAASHHSPPKKKRAG